MAEVTDFALIELLLTLSGDMVSELTALITSESQSLYIELYGNRLPNHFVFLLPQRTDRTSLDITFVASDVASLQSTLANSDSELDGFSFIQTPEPRHLEFTLDKKISLTVRISKETTYLVDKYIVIVDVGHKKAKSTSHIEPLAFAGPFLSCKSIHLLLR